MKTQAIRNKALSAALIRMLGILSIAHADVDDVSKRWQINTLNTPSLSQLQREKEGHVMIYHGLKDTAVENAMDTQFDRLSSMMFTGVVVTDQNGDTKINPDTGLVEVEEDGCD